MDNSLMEYCTANGRLYKVHCDDTLNADDRLLVNEFKKFPEENMDEVCWICGCLADSREHSAKRSDVKQWLHTPTQKNPLYYSSDYHTNRRLNTVNDNLLTWSKMICRQCNNVRTQPYDLAWEMLSRELSEMISENRVPKYINLAKIFHKNCRKMGIFIQLYFAKYLGCAINNSIADEDDKAHILKLLSAHLMNKEVCHDLYIKLINTNGLRKIITPGNLITYSDERNSKIIKAGIFYKVGVFVIEVIYIPQHLKMLFSRGVWNPRFGSKMRVITESLGN